MATDMARIAQYIQKALKSVEQLQLLEMLLEGRPHEMKYLEPFIKNDVQNGAAAKAVEDLNLTAEQKEILLTLVRSLIDPDLTEDGPLKIEKIREKSFNFPGQWPLSPTLSSVLEVADEADQELIHQLQELDPNDKASSASLGRGDKGKGKEKEELLAGEGTKRQDMTDMEEQLLFLRRHFPEVSDTAAKKFLATCRLVHS